MQQYLGHAYVNKWWIPMKASHQASYLQVMYKEVSYFIWEYFLRKDSWFLWTLGNLSCWITLITSDMDSSVDTLSGGSDIEGHRVETWDIEELKWMFDEIMMKKRCFMSRTGCYRRKGLKGVKLIFTRSHLRSQWVFTYEQLERVSYVHNSVMGGNGLNSLVI